LKLATTLDGKIADSSGNAKWITNKQSRTFVHELRRRHAAVAVGKGTLLRDNPRLTVRHVKGCSPARIVFASSPEIPENCHFRKDASKYQSILVCKGGQRRRIEKRPDGVEVWYTGYKKNREHLSAFLRMAFDAGLTSIFIEGGRKLASSFLEHKLINRLYIFYSNTILGQGIESFSFAKHLTIDNTIRIGEIKTHSFGNNFLITGIPYRDK